MSRSCVPSKGISWVTVLSNHRGSPRWTFTGHAWEQLELGRLAGDADLLCLGNVAPVERLIRRTGRTFTMVHDLSYQYFPSAYSLGFRAFYSAVIPLVLSRSDAVFTVSETERKAILKHHGKRISVDRLHAVQNGAIRKGSDAGVAPPLPPDQREPFVLYVGSLTLRKNAPRLIQACIELARQTDLDFVFIGATGASFGALNISLPEDLKSRFHFLGQINDSRVIYDHLSRASLFCFRLSTRRRPYRRSRRWHLVARLSPAVYRACSSAAARPRNSAIPRTSGASSPRPWPF